MCSIERDPRRDDHTICTAVAPELVFTVRTYATQGPYGPPPSAQIRTRIQLNPQVTALQDRRTRNTDKSQVRVSKNASDDVPVNSTLFMYQQAFILGYPYGLSFMPKDSFQEFPIVKSCIIAGNRTGEDGVAIFYIDTIVNPGFSGGPLCFIDKKTQQPKFAGVVAKGMLAPIREPTVDDPNPPQGPAGIGVVVGEINFRDALKPDAH